LLGSGISADERHGLNMAREILAIHKFVACSMQVRWDRVSTLRSTKTPRKTYEYKI
jgi:hypothetical protein